MSIRNAVAVLLLAIAASLVPIFLLVFADSGRTVEVNAKDAERAAKEAQSELLDLPDDTVELGDFDAIKERRVLRVLVPYSKTFFFLDHGRAEGIDAELARALENWLDKRHRASNALRFHVQMLPTARDRLLDNLREGKGDVVMANLTVTEERSERVDFTEPMLKNVSEVLVTGPSSPSITGIEDLSGKEVFARPSSSYHAHLEALNATFEEEGRDPVLLRDAAEELEDEDLLEMVNAGLLPAIFIDDHKAAIWAPAFDRLVVHEDIVLHEGGQIAMAIRKRSPLLKAELDAFVEEHQIGTTFGNIMKQRYMESDLLVKEAFGEGEIDRFHALEGLFETYGDMYGIDPLLLAAQGFQESGLDQTARSQSGAVGLMQVLPSTAADPKIAIDGIEDSTERNVEAGVKYLRFLIDRYLDDPEIDDMNRVLMGFAAYNAGPRNLRRFRGSAEKSGLDPNVWFGNVEHGAAQIVGRETVQYVSNIYKYYIAYKLIAAREAEAARIREAAVPEK